MPTFWQNLATIQETAVPFSGGKARALVQLLAAGFPVPPAWVVLPEAFADEHLTAAARQTIIDTLTNQYTQQPTVAFAVRSSGEDEDSAAHAFAGVFETLLNVALEKVPTAVEAVYASRQQAKDYRQAHGLDEQQTMAVMVQELVAADCAGGCLTVDPVAQRADRLVINAAWGLGAGVMDGRVPTDSYWLKVPDLSLVQQHIATKDIQLVATTNGITETAVPAEQQRLPCLPPAWLERIGQFALALTRYFGHPQEVEWAVAADKLWILQSRPQTALAPQLVTVAPFPVVWEGDEECRLWQLMEYSQGETLPLPLEHDTMQVRESIREETCRIMGADRNMAMRIWNGRAYATPLPLGITASDQKVRRAAAADLHQRLQQQGQTTWDHWGPEIISAVERLRRFDRTTADGEALADHLAEALAVLRRHAFLHPQLVIKPPQSYFDAFTAVSGITGDEAATTAYQLLDSEENTLTRLIDGIYALASTARQQPRLAAWVAQPPTTIMERLAELPEAAAFQQQLADLLAIYGERIGEGYGSEVSVTTPTWLEDPARLLRLVALFLDSTVPASAIRRAHSRAQREVQVAALCAACEDQTAVETFQRELAYARRVTVLLEDHNHWIEQASGGQLRLAVMAAARWLVSQGILKEAQEIFWLTYAEIDKALRTALLKSDLIVQRQDQYKQWALLEAPLFLGLPKSTLPPRPLQTAVPEEAQSGETGGRLHGLGASPGQVEGRVRLLPKAAVEVTIERGDILVAVNAGPLWTPFFPILGGLILEEGSLGQHAAVTAREYGIPAVINVPQATQHLTDGEWVSVDGSTGIIIR